jgi:superfamily II DNA or RNA helicase/ribonuclease HI
MGDIRNEYEVSIKSSVSHPIDLRNTEKATCSCESTKYITAKRGQNHCSHLLACEFYRSNPQGEELVINKNIDAEHYHFKIALNKQGEIILEKNRQHNYVDLGKDKWKEHLFYKGDGVFYLKNKTWYNLQYALEYLESYCDILVDIEFFRNYFNVKDTDIDIIKINEEAKNVNAILDGERVFYYFKVGYEKYCTFIEILSYKEWRYKQIRPVTYEKEKSNKDTIVFSTSVGFSPLFAKFLHEKGFILSGVATPQPETYEFSLKPGVIPQDYQEEAVASWNQHNIGIIVAPTASGKTSIGAIAIASKGVKTLILVHSKDTIRQWETSILEFLDIREHEIGLFGFGNKVVYNKKIIIAMYISLWRDLKAIKNFNVGLVISDEYLDVSAKTFQEVNEHLDCPFKLGLITSQTLEEKDGGIFTFYDKIIHEVGSQDLLADKYNSPVVFYTLYLQDDNIYKAMEEEDKITLEKLRELSSKSVVKHDALKKLVGKIIQKRLCFIIFTDRVEVAEQISTVFSIPFLSIDLSFSEREDIFKKLQNKEIVGVVTARLLTSGFMDIPNLDVVIDLVSYKSHSSLLQKIDLVNWRNEEKRIGFYVQFVLKYPDLKEKSENESGNIAIKSVCQEIEEGELVRDPGLKEKGEVGLTNWVELEDKWAGEAYQSYISEAGFGKMTARRVVNSVEDIDFGLKRTIKAIEKRRENLIKKGEKSEQELLNFLKANPDIYQYQQITKKLNWSQGKVSKAMQRLERKGLIKKSDYLKKIRETIIRYAVVLRCDGGCKPNPGEMAVGVTITEIVGGEGKENGRLITEISEKLGEGTNNQAEYQAVIKGLEYVQQKFLREETEKLQDIAVLTDSQLVINQVSDVDRVNEPELWELCYKVREIIEFFKSQNIPVRLNYSKDTGAAHDLTVKALRRLNH